MAEAAGRHSDHLTPVGLVDLLYCEVILAKFVVDLGAWPSVELHGSALAVDS